MSERLSRRRALKHLAAAGAAAAFSPVVIRGQSAPIRLAGMPVEISVASISPVTVRITVAAIVGTAGVPDDGALVAAAEGKPLARRRTPDAFTAVRAGNLTVRYTADPPAIHVDTIKGQPVQRLTLSVDEPGLSFLLPKGPLLGFGEGGPQFDRKGSVDRMRNGQGGYQLRTHGGRVPIQWLVGTDGWGMFVHHPLGAFDFSGPEGRLTPAADGAAARRLHRVFAGSQGHPRRIRAHHRTRGAAAAVVVRLHAIASNPGGPRRGDVGREDVPREAAAVRRADLSRHGVHAVGMEHTQRRVRVEEGELPGSEEGHRRSPRAALQGRAALRDRRPAHEWHRRRILHARQGCPERTHAGRPLARGSRRRMLLAVSQAGDGPRRRRLVAGSRRWPGRPVAARPHPHVLGRTAALSSERAAVRAAPQRLLRHAALRRVPVVG